MQAGELLVDAVRVDGTNDVGQPEPVAEPHRDVARRGERLAELGEELGDLRAVVLAAREAMTNAAKFSGVDEVDVYTEVSEDEVAVFIRDRGAGFDRAAVRPDRRGLVESIERRLERAGGRATVVTAPGEGTEIELRLPRRRP